MNLVNITESMTINTDCIQYIIALPQNTVASETDTTYQDIQNVVATAKEKEKYLELIDKKIGIKSVIVFVGGMTYGLSLTKEELDQLVDGEVI